MTQAHETHPTRRVHQQVRSALQRRLQRAVDTVAPATARDPRAGVAYLALEGCALGWYAQVYPDTERWWDRTLGTIARYCGLPAPRRRLGSSSPRWEQFPLRDEQPLLDAVFTLIQHSGIQSVTLARVAKVSGRDLDWLVSMYGTVDELLVVILDRVASDGFDDLAPLHLEPSIEGVRSMLEVYSDDRRSAALLRSVLLTGFTISSGAALAAQKLSPITRPESDALSDEEWIAALAIDGWALSTSATATSCSTTTTSAFPESPCASARPPIPAPTHDDPHAARVSRG